MAYIPKGSRQCMAVATVGDKGSTLCAGIRRRDRLLSVVYVAGAGMAVTDVSDITSEFDINVDGYIDNTDRGIDRGGKLLVSWLRPTT